MFKRALPWSRKMTPPGDALSIKGNKVVLREKRIEDAPDDYAWRVDEELARLDATRPLRMSYEDFVRYSKRSWLTLAPGRSALVSIRTRANISATACTTTST